MILYIFIVLYIQMIIKMYYNELTFIHQECINLIIKLLQKNQLQINVVLLNFLFSKKIQH